MADKQDANNKILQKIADLQGKWLQDIAANTEPRQLRPVVNVTVNVPSGQSGHTKYFTSV